MTNPDLTDVLDFAFTVNHLPITLRKLVKGAFDNPTEGAPKLFARLANDADETEIVAFLLPDAVEFHIVNAETLAALFDTWMDDRTDDGENVDLMIAEANLNAPKGGR